MRKRFIQAMSLTLTCGILLTGCGTKSESLVEGNVPFYTINDTEIQLGEAMIYVDTIKQQYESVYGTDIWDTTVGTSTLEESIKSDIISQLEEVELMYAHATDYNVSLSEEDEESVATTIKNYLSTHTEEEFAELGITEEQVNDTFRKSYIAELVYEAMTETDESEINEDDLKIATVQYILLKNYSEDEDGNASYLTDDELAKQKALAEECLEKAKAGEDFESLMKEYSDDYNENYIDFDVAKDQTIEEFETAAFALKEGELSDVIETDSYGYFVIKCISPYGIPTNEEKLESLKESAISTLQAEKYNELMTAWDSEANIELNEDIWSTVTLSYTLSSDTTSSNVTYELDDEDVEDLEPSETTEIETN